MVCKDGNKSFCYGIAEQVLLVSQRVIDQGVGVSMHIAFGFDIFYPETNGVITTTINLANNLIKMGHKVWFFVPREHAFKDDVIEDGIRIVHVKSIPAWIYKGIKLLPIYGSYLMPYLIMYKIDIVHNTSPWLMGMALNHAARRLHIPTLATHHTLIDNPIYIKYALKSKKLANAAQDAIWTVVFNPFFRLTWMATAPNEETCRHVREKIPGLEVRYVSNGIDISRFQNGCTRELPAQIDPSWLGKRTLLYVGRLGYEKAIDVAIEAFSICLKKNSDAHFIVIGQGPAHDALIRLSETLGLEGHLHMTGMIPNEEIIGSGIIRKVSAFVTASLSENQAITVIEALCSGTPVIAADVENMRALFSEKEGWFFSGGDPASLADMMDHVLNNPEERDEKAENAGKLITRFDGREVAKQFEGIYRELLEMKKEGFYVPGGEKRAMKYLKKVQKNAEK